MNRFKLAAALWATAVCCVWAAPAAATVPATVAIEGNLLTSAGGPVADGSYAVTFSLYKDKSGGGAVWSETAAKMPVAGGAFQHTLGSIKPIKGIDGATTGWLGITIGKDPELARNRLNAVPFALRASVAEGLACTGCVSVAQMKFDGDIDLGKFGIKAASGTFTNVNAANIKSTNINATSINAAAVTSTGIVKAKTFLGDGSKLTGIKTAAGTCSVKGEVVKGIDANGKLVCVKALDPDNLPADGLDTISNGLLTTEFTDTFTNSTAVPIKDNWPIGVKSTLVVADVGMVKAIRVSIHITNSNFTKAKIHLTDPAGGKYVLFDSGKTAGGVIKTTYPAPTKPVSGDLGQWIGKNAKGTWTLEVVDGHFKDNKTDGEIKSWAVEIDTLSDKKVATNGALLASGGFGFPVATKPPFNCDAGHVGRSYANSKTNQLFICLGGKWRAVALQACGNAILEIGETCDAGTKNSDTVKDACRTTCSKAKCGDKVVDTGEGCDDGNLVDGDSCKNNCTLPCTGWLYKNVCLRSAVLSQNSDVVPSGCTAYQPAGTNWQKSDYTAICNHFKKAGTNCTAVDTDADGGRCSNHQALVSWESNTNPDIWVHSTTFSWSPNAGGNNCNLYSAASVVVYACK